MKKKKWAHYGRGAHEIKKNLMGAPIKERQWASPIFCYFIFFRAHNPGIPTGSRIWAFEGQFRASRSSFLVCGRWVWALVVKLNSLRVDFTCLKVELEKLGVLTVQLVLNTLPPG